MSPDERPEADVEVEAQEATPENTEPAPREPWVYIRHVGNSVKTRAMRRARAGFRRKGVVLDGGLRIRKRGKKRMTAVGMRELVNNHERLLTFMDNGILEVIDPKTMEPLTREQLVEGIAGMVESFGRELTPPKVESPYSLPSTRGDATRPDIDAAAMTAAVDQANAMRDGEGNPPPSENGEEPEEYTKSDLKKMDREQLDELARENDVDPSQYSSKAKLIDALLEE